MEELFLSIMEKLAELKEAGKIAWVDEDRGQLQEYEDDYPITYPAVLINIAQIEWQDARRNEQMGDAQITVSLAIDSYKDSHYGSTQEDDARDRMLLFKEMNDKLQGFKATDAVSPLVRRLSRMYSLPHEVRVYENTYYCRIVEDVNFNYSGIRDTSIVPDKG